MKKRVLATLLSLCMVLALLPTVALADSTDPVAQIGEGTNATTYETLQAAITAAQDGQTVTLLKNYTVSTAEGTYTGYIMPDNSVLDLGGHTLTVPFAAAVFEGKNITIQNGRFESDANYAIWIGNGKNETNATLKDITSNGGVNVYAAQAVLENCDINASTKTYYAVWGDNGNVEITIKSGTYTGGTCGAVVNASDGYYNGAYESDPAKITIQGGNFTGEVWIQNRGYGVTGQVNISGGTFTSDVSAYVTGSAKQEELEDGTYTVRPLTANDPESVAKVNDTYYTTLAAAITAAQNGNTVTLLKDVTVTKTVTIGKSLTIDLNGKTLTGENCRTLHITSGELELTGTGTVKSTGIAVGSSVIRVGDNNGEVRNAALVIGSNVVIDAPDSYGVGAFGTATNETVTINGTVTSTAPANDAYDGCAVSTLGSDTTSATITIKEGATISATNTNAIYLPSGTLIVEGGEITGTTGIYVKSGITTITGGTITGNGPAEAYNYYGNGGISTGDALVVDSCGYPNGNPQVSVTGGTFTSTNAKAVASYATEGNSAVTNFITGGTFSSDPTAYVAGGYIAKKNSETEYAVIAKANLTSGVYMSDPTDYTAVNHYVTKNDDGTWTVFYVAPYVAPTYSITVESAKHGDVTVSPRNASKGDKVTVTVKPDEGYTLETLTVTDKNGDEIELTNKGDGKYTFTMPAGKVYVEATFMEDNSVLNFFVDVFPGDYYYDAVLWAVKNGITGGVDAAHFAPNATCTRAQVVTFLWRAAGSPAPKSSMMPFTDVPAGSYYETAVLWAAENGITGGTGNNAFSPDAACTRGQIVSFLWRALGSPAAGTVNPFTDVAADAYYNTAVLWAAENGITGGTGNNAFSPDADCTRAQIVTFLYRSET